jgi:hypothetical protein
MEESTAMKTEREKFEEWHREEYALPDKNYGYNRMLDAWLARAALDQKVEDHRAHEPKVLTVDEIANICLSDEYGLSDSGSARLAQAIHDAIYNGGR